MCTRERQDDIQQRGRGRISFCWSQVASQVPRRTLLYFVSDH